MPWGHYNSKEALQALKVGDSYGPYTVLPYEGTYQRHPHGFIKFNVPFNSELRDYEISYAEDGSFVGQDAHGVWLNVPDPELVAVREWPGSSPRGGGARVSLVLPSALGNGVNICGSSGLKRGAY